MDDDVISMRSRINCDRILTYPDPTHGGQPGSVEGVWSHARLSRLFGTEPSISEAIDPDGCLSVCDLAVIGERQRASFRSKTLDHSAGLRDRAPLFGGRAAMLRRFASPARRCRAARLRGSASAFIDEANWGSAAVKYGFIVVAPEGLPIMTGLPSGGVANPRVWNSGQYSSHYPRTHIDDVGFIIGCSTTPAVDGTSTRVGRISPDSPTAAPWRFGWPRSGPTVSRRWPRCRASTGSRIPARAEPCRPWWFTVTSTRWSLGMAA